MELSQMIDAGKAFDYWINSQYDSLSNFARTLTTKDEVIAMFHGEEVTEAKVRAKLEWIKKKRKFTPSDLGKLEKIYGIDTNQMMQEYARLTGATITGSNNVTNSTDTSISVNEHVHDQVLLTEITFLKKENKILKEQLQRTQETVDLLQGLLKSKS